MIRHLIFCVSTFIIYDHLKASRHAFDEFAAIFRSYPKCPNFFYHIFHLLQTAELFFSHLVFQYYPQIFNRIEVRTVAGPIKNLNFCTFLKVANDLCFIAWGAILHENSTFMHIHVKL